MIAYQLNIIHINLINFLLLFLFTFYLIILLFRVITNKLLDLFARLVLGNRGRGPDLDPERLPQ